jgi:TolB-like protein/DNA-binding winged helix-turn-helix (wHTH) protein
MAVQLHYKYLLGDFELDLDKCLLSRNTIQVHLPDLPFQVLLYLVRNRQRYVSRRELLDQFWAGSDAYEETLTKCISTIRAQLDDLANAPRFIETRKKVGYRYIGLCQELNDGGSVQRPNEIDVEHVRSVAITIEEDNDFPLNNSVSQFPAATRHHGRWKAALLVLFAVLFVGAAFIFYESSRRSPKPDNLSIRSIAVLPLRNLTGNPANDYFSDGLTESLINFLSKVDGLSVQSRSSVFRFKNKDENLQALGSQLGVAAILEGSVRRASESVRVEVRLVSVMDGKVLWVNDSEDRPMPDLFALQDEIAREVVTKLQLHINKDAERRLSHHDTKNIEAYQEYLQGRYFLNNFATYNDLLRAVQYFNSAVAKDPKYALAYCGLADSYIGMALDFRSPTEVFPIAREYAQKALDLDRDLGEAHYSRGAIAYFYEWDWENARRELNTAMLLNAKTLEMNSCYLHSLETSEPPDKAVAQVQRALENNPLSIGISSELSCAAYYAGRYDEAITFALQTSQMDSGYVFVHYNMARALGQQHLHEEALKELQKANAVWGRTPTTLSELGFNYAAMGKKAGAKKILAELRARSADQFTDPYPMAFILVALNEKDQALTMLEQAFRVHSAWMPWIRVEPKFDTLRREPRFIALLKQLKMQPA